MTDIFKGIMAGSMATAVLTVLLLVKSALGIVPQVRMIHLLLVVLGSQSDRPLGWILHFLMGSVIGGALFACIESRLEANTPTKRGVLFGLLLWLVMMLIFMPAAGAGLFGFQLTVLAPIVTLVLHVVYGAVLGWIYGKLSPTRDSFATHGGHHPA